jgi:hypothetical protein
MASERHPGRQFIDAIASKCR